MGYHQHHDPDAEHFIDLATDHQRAEHQRAPTHHHRTVTTSVYYYDTDVTHYGPDDAEHADPARINAVYPDDYTRAARDRTTDYGRGPGA